MCQYKDIWNVDGRPDLVREAGGRVRRGRGDHGLDPHHGLELVLGQISASAHCAATSHLLESLLPVTNHSPRASARSIILPVTSNSLLLPPSVPRSLRIHSVDMLKRDHSDKINPCIYLYDNIKFD